MTEQIGIENCSPVSGAVLQTYGEMVGGPIDDVMLNPQALVTSKFYWKLLPLSHPGIASTYVFMGIARKTKNIL